MTNLNTIFTSMTFFSRSNLQGKIVTSALLIFICVAVRAAEPNPPSVSRFCKPDQPCWPSAAEWKQFGSRLVGKLEVPKSPVEPCRQDPVKEACLTAQKNLRNPFALQEQSGATQSSGWLGAWTTTPSRYAVVAEKTSDIVAGVKFARLHRLRLVVKGTGHDYLGRSSAPDSLLIWTHKMRRIKLGNKFVAQGCPASQAGIPAVTVEAGTRWLEAYQAVTVKNHRYVQGGGCTSVGAAGGFLQGGGFGHWSKKYGTAASNLLEAEVVTADGSVVVANACQNQDLFWALRGGGGGTYGIVTRVTMRTHALPKYFGWVNGEISAKSDADFKILLEQFIEFYGKNLSNEKWGEQVRVTSKNSLQLALAYLNMTAKEAEKVWEPMRTFVEANPAKFTMKAEFNFIPAEKMWDFDFIQKNYPSAIVADKRTGRPSDLYFWKGDQDQVSTFWYTYQSRWIPLDLFEFPKNKSLAAVFFEASRHWDFELHFNKGQAGASPEAVERGKETSVNPALYKAATLLIAAAGAPGYPTVSGFEPKKGEGENQRMQVNALMKLIREATPGAGSYVNETDYFEPNWQQEFWGENYPKLLTIKLKYDPEKMFTCHHCVGSE